MKLFLKTFWHYIKVLATRCCNLPDRFLSSTIIIEYVGWLSFDMNPQLFNFVKLIKLSIDSLIYSDYWALYRYWKYSGGEKSNCSGSQSTIILGERHYISAFIILSSCTPTPYPLRNCVDTLFKLFSRAQQCLTISTTVPWYKWTSSLAWLLQLSPKLCPWFGPCCLGHSHYLALKKNSCHVSCSMKKPMWQNTEDYYWFLYF